MSGPTLYQLFRRAAELLEKKDIDVSVGGCWALTNAAHSFIGGDTYYADVAYMRLLAHDLMVTLYARDACRTSPDPAYWGEAFGAHWRNGRCELDREKVRKGRLLMLDFLAEITRGVRNDKAQDFVNAIQADCS